jgi:hypothetical protein
MIIRFACPNGHPLTAREEHVGREFKCPKCSLPVVVPASPALGAEVAEGAAQAPSGPEDIIVFLCPNGHRLHGPRSLEGRAGQCPHCGARFRVPSQDDPDEEEEQGSRILVGATPDAGELAVQRLPGPDGGGASDEPFFSFKFEDSSGSGRGSSAVTEAPPAIETAGGSQIERHPLADLFTRFWDERARGAFVELHLGDGVVVVPERYARELSRGKYGVFAVKDPDGTHTLTVLAWDAISRVSVRRVSKLPRKIFD